MPGNAMQKQTASVPLNVVVVGGSIGGLSAAYALQSAGHHVVLLEQNDGIKPGYGGLRSPPNLTRVLCRWGLAPHLNKLGIKCPQFVWRQGHNGDLIGVMKIHEQFLRDLCADFALIQHGDLQAMLFDIAVREGVEIRYNSRVVDVDIRAPSVTLANGKVIQADLVVGADGPNSVTRSAVLGGKSLQGPYTRFLCITFTIPTDVLRQHEELQYFSESHDWSVWLGHEYLIRASLVNAKTQYSLTLTIPQAVDPKQAAQFGELWKWNDQWTLENLPINMDHYEPRVQKMFQLASHITATAYVDRPPVESVVCEWGRVVIVGESAHPLQPNAMHSAALVVEDAEVLGSLFSRLHQKDEIPRLLSAYEELRLSRGVYTQEYEVRKTAMLTLPIGPAQEARDATLRRATIYESWDHMDEKSFREMWGDEMEMFEYDATEKVEDWWTKWGGFMSRPRTSSMPPTPTVQVSVSKED